MNAVEIVINTIFEGEDRNQLNDKFSDMIQNTDTDDQFSTTECNKDTDKEFPYYVVVDAKSFGKYLIPT